ncbi:MAG: hypothetical protein ACE5JG_10015, partial [Planctomycetota bacterium]
MASFRVLAPLPAWLVLGAAVWAQDLEDVVRRQGERIDRLQREVKELRAERQSDLDDEIDLYLQESRQSVAWAQSPDSGGGLGGRVRLGGYFSFEARDDGDGRNFQFDQHRLVLKVSSDIYEDVITFETEIEIEGGGADVDFLTGNEILVEYAELHFQIAEDALTLKLGALLIPWGLFNQIHDDPLNDLTDRPVVSRRLGLVAFDQPGIGAEGTFEPFDGIFLDYDVVVVQGFDDDITTNDGARNARQSFREDNNNGKQLFYR